MVIFAGVALASPNINPCSIEEAARFGASHVLVVDYTDLAASAGTSTNVIVAFTNTVTAPCSIGFVCYDLFSSFDTQPGLVSYNGTTATFNKQLTNSMTVYSGTTTTSNLWINGVQAANDQTPTVYGSFGSSTIFTNNANRWLDSQTSDVGILTTFIPGATATNVWGSLIKGRVKLYFDIIGKKTSR